jgi:hypothetical protein
VTLDFAKDDGNRKFLKGDFLGYYSENRKFYASLLWCELKMKYRVGRFHHPHGSMVVPFFSDFSFFFPLFGGDALAT